MLVKEEVNVHVVARHAGVSQATVSRVFSGTAPVATQTRLRVMKIANRMGYRPNRLASGLRGGRTRSIGVIWQFSDPWGGGDPLVTVDLLDRFGSRGFATYQAQHQESPDAIRAQLDDMLDRRVDAIVLQATPTQLLDVRLMETVRQAKCLVAVTREPIPDFPHDLVIHDREAAIGQVAEHFVATGRKHPAFIINSVQESNPSKIRAFREECLARGLEPHDFQLIDLHYPDRPEDLGDHHRHAVSRALDAGADKVVDAMFCFNDVGAMYVMRELADRGFRVPEDVAVVGFNDMQAGRVWSPPLASGDRRARDLAAAIDGMLERRLERPELPPQRQTVSMRFVWRASAGGHGLNQL